MVFAATAAWLAAGCGGSGETVDAGGCPAGQVPRYESAGCDESARPVCGSARQDACFRPVCSCTGVTISRCDYASEPFSSFGACLVPDGGPADVPATPDSPVALDSPPAPDLPTGLDSPPLLDAPPALDSPEALDSPPQTVDSGPCPAGQVLRYESAGCGESARPVCGSGQQDACFRPVCSCKGETISRCDYATEPFASFGACPQPDGGGEAGTNP